MVLSIGWYSGDAVVVGQSVDVYHVSVSVFLPIHGGQLAPLRSRGELSDPGEEQQTLVAGLSLQLGRDRLHPVLLYRNNPGMDSLI